MVKDKIHSDVFYSEDHVHGVLGQVKSFVCGLLPQHSTINTDVIQIKPSAMFAQDIVLIMMSVYHTAAIKQLMPYGCEQGGV